MKNNFYTKNIKGKNIQATTTEIDFDCFQYNVCWRSGELDINKWNIKFFADKKEAQEFARQQKLKNRTKPYPYIIQSIDSSLTFKKDVNLEPCNIDFKNGYDKFRYRKFIKY